MRDGSLNGSRRRKRSLIKLKIAVFSPIPSASVTTAIKVNPGDLRSWRRANLRSLILFCAQRDYRIDPRGAAGWYKTGKQSGDGKSCSSNGNQKQIMRRDLVKLSRDEMTRAKRGGKADYQPKQNRIHPLLHHEPQNICDLRAERHAHSDFARSLFDGVSDRTVNSDDREQQRNTGKRAEQSHRQPLLTERLHNNRIESVWLQNWDFLVDLVERAANDRLRSVRFHRSAYENVEK